MIRDTIIIIINIIKSADGFLIQPISMSLHAEAGCYDMPEQCTQDLKYVSRQMPHPHEMGTQPYTLLGNRRNTVAICHQVLNLDFAREILRRRGLSKSS